MPWVDRAYRGGPNSPPIGVRIRLRSGDRIVPDGLLYGGVVDDVHVWQVVLPVQVTTAQVDGIDLRMLPSRSRVTVTIQKAPRA